MSNVSSGFWTNAWQAGTTIYLTKSKATQISVFNNYAWNTTQLGAGIHPGQNDSVDYSLSQTFSLSKSGKWSLLVGGLAMVSGKPPGTEGRTLFVKSWSMA